MNNNMVEKATLVFFLINSFFINVGYNIFTSLSNNDSVINILIASIINLMIILIVFYIKKYNNNLLKTINTKKYIKYPIYIMILFILSISAIYFLITITNFIHYYIIKEASIFTISISYTLIVIYLISKDLSVITRTSNICFYVYIILLVIGYIGIINYIDLDNILPVLTNDINTNIKTILLFNNYSIYPIFLILFIDTKKVDNKYIFILSIISYLNIIITLFLIISILGINLTNIYIYPDIAIYKKISFLNIIERVEIFLSFNQILNSIFITSMSMYIIKKIINTTLKIKKERVSLTLFFIITIILINTISIPKDIYLSINTISFVFILILFIYTIISRIYKIIFNTTN